MLLEERKYAKLTDTDICKLNLYGFFLSLAEQILYSVVL